MARSTSNLNLTLFDSSDIVDFDQINNNFNILDNVIYIVKSGQVVSTFNDGSGANSSFRWYYKKFSDKTINLSGAINISNLVANEPDSTISGGYRSKVVEVVIPTTFDLSNIISVHTSMVSNSYDWLANVQSTATNKIAFCVVSPVQQSSYYNRTIYMDVTISVNN